MWRVFNRLILLLSVFLVLNVGIFPQVDARLLRYPDVSETRITFVYAGDIWVAPKSGGLAQRLSSPPGEESFPRFSPDGKHIAFSGNYDGNTDVYVIPIQGGIPSRLTHHPSNDRMVDWYPDGGSLLYASNMASGRSVFNQFYKTSPQGGMPEKLPVPYGEFAAISPEGKFLAFTTINNEFSTWKRYRGGRASDIWLMDLAKKTARNITRSDAVDSLPMWHGDTIYFLSDRGENMRGNIWAYDIKSEKIRQVTFFKDFDVRFPSLGPSEIIFEKGGQLHLLALKDEKVHPVNIQVVTDKASLKPRTENVSNLIRTRGISPTGKRAVFEARGDIFTVPAEHGVICNLTRTPGIAERHPSWSPDGRWIAYFSDGSGEYQLMVRPAEGPGEEIQLTSLGKGFRYPPRWSPDSKKIVFLDKTQNIHLYNFESKTLTTIDKITWYGYYGLERFRLSWSADSRWLAYSRPLANERDAIFLLDTQTPKRYQVTSGYYSERDPVFDPEGKFLYFFSSRYLQPVYSDLQPTWVYVNSTRIVAMALRKDVKSPLLPRNDQEEIAADEEDKKKNQEEKSKDKKDKDKKEKSKVTPVKIDFTGLEERVVILTPKAGNYYNLNAVKGKVIYHRGLPAGIREGKRAIVYYDLEEREEKTILEDAWNYILSADSKKLLVRKDTTYAIIDLKPNQEIKKPLMVNNLTMTVDPAAEWRQIFIDAWRFERDFFYDDGLHGVDWELMRQRYGKLLEDAVTRWDVNFVIGELIGELSAGHIFYFGGQTETPKRSQVGLLGVDFELHQGAYRIKDIIDVSAWDSEDRSPLRMPGVEVNEGDYILAVNGVPIDTGKDPWAAFQGLAEQTVILTVNSQPSRQGSRQVPVETLSNESLLREKAWVEANRRKVEKASSGRIGYIYVRNTSFSGQTEFVRQYMAQLRKQGLIIDERFNTGGQLADRFVEMMNRPVYNYIYIRDNADQQHPATTNTGPKVMLMNGWSGSGGDAFPYYFRQAKIGPLIGTRTWGGLVGPAYPLPLIDGGYVSAPPGRFYMDGKWVIENIGVVPDIPLVNNPGDMALGRDPQLERAIQEVMNMLEKNPPQKPKVPILPSKAK